MCIRDRGTGDGEGDGDGSGTGDGGSGLGSGGAGSAGEEPELADTGGPALLGPLGLAALVAAGLLRPRRR